ncbi:MAG: hypothetical protein H6625_12095 [Bdellovibrionaceae bacterium]|nr:hypothetical protein [Pseudobdellovibrionaceae bacterium]
MLKSGKLNIEYFLPKNLREPTKNINNIELFKSRIQIYFSYAFSLLSLFIFVYRYLFSEVVWSVYGFLVFPILMMSCNFLLRKYSLFKTTRVLMIFLLTLAIVIRAYSAGGVYAPGVFSIALIPALGLVFFGVRWGWILMILSVGLVFLIFATTSNAVLEEPIILAFSIIAIALLTFIPTVILYTELKKLNKNFLAIERSKSSLITLSRLAHEINNPLYVISGTVEINIDHLPEDDYATITRNIDRISKTIKAMSSYAENHCLPDVLERHKNTIHIFDVLEESQRVVTTRASIRIPDISQ